MFTERDRKFLQIITERNGVRSSALHQSLSVRYLDEFNLILYKLCTNLCYIRRLHSEGMFALHLCRYVFWHLFVIVDFVLYCLWTELWACIKGSFHSVCVYISYICKTERLALYIFFLCHRCSERSLFYFWPDLRRNATLFFDRW